MMLCYLSGNGGMGCQKKASAEISWMQDLGGVWMLL